MRNHMPLKKHWATMDELRARCGMEKKMESEFLMRTEVTLVDSMVMSVIAIHPQRLQDYKELTTRNFAATRGQ